jgi:hypothetical protein
MDRQTQHKLASCFADAFPKPCHLRWINWQLMLKVRLTAEVLPVWVLCPTRHHFFIRQIVGVLQIVQSDHQPNRDARPFFFRVKIAELFFGCVPVNLAGQFVQRVTLIQHLIQPQPEQVILGNLLDFRWFHFARNPYATDRILANSTSLEYPFKQINSPFLWGVQGRLF